MKRRVRRIAVQGAILVGSAFYVGCVLTIDCLDHLGLLRDPRG